MRNDLNDELPMDAWVQRRMVQVGPSRAKLRTLPVLRDDMPIGEWVELRNDQKQDGGTVSGGAGVDRLIGGDGGDRLEGQSRAIAQPARPDPRRTEVFQRGPDGKLHPVEGWHTTGPFAFGEWAKNVDWGGIAHDLGDLGFDVATWLLPTKSKFEKAGILLGLRETADDTYHELDDLDRRGR